MDCDKPFTKTKLFKYDKFRKSYAIRTNESKGIIAIENQTKFNI